MNARLSKSLPCVRTSIFRALSPWHAAPSPRCLLSHSYATAAAATRAAEQRRAPRSFARPPTPPPSKTPEEQSHTRGYLVQRTASAQLPVYRALKSGGTRVVILVKKVHGDRGRLVEDIKADLAVAADRIRVNPTTQHVELQGNYFSQTQQWLLDNGF